MSTILTDDTVYTIAQIANVIADCLTEPYAASDNLRTAAMQSPLIMTTAEWVRACAEHNINAGTARNRLNEVRRFQRDIGEVAS